tara:strand:+ start:84 stop:1451 length:1368 start_codon:yes stop_codon:yes gene_type:complete
MPSTYSPSLRIELIGAGEQSGTWGTTTNTNLGTLLEQSIAGVQAITMTNANYTLTNFNGVSDEARRAVLVVSGTNAAIRDVIAPLATKSYTIKNSTTGDFAINIRAATGASVSIPNGVTSLVYCDGTNFNLAVNQTSVAAGTGLSATTVGATTTVSFGPLTSAQLATALTDETGTDSAVFATSPTLVTPALGTPTALVGTNITGTATNFTATRVTTNANLTGAVTSVGNASSLGSFTSAQLLTALTDETGTGANVFATSPTLVSPALGTPTALVGTNITGTATSFTAGNATNAVTATNATTASILNGTWNQLPAGTRMPFAQITAPTGWTQDVTDNANNRMLRFINTTTGVPAASIGGGTSSPILNNTVPSHTHTFTGTAHTHTDSGHVHNNNMVGGTGFAGGGFTVYSPGAGVTNTLTGFAAISSTVAGGTNAANAGAADWAPRYLNMILCTKN